MSKNVLMSRPHFWNDFLQVAVFAASFCLTTFVYSIVVLPFELMFDEDGGIRTCILGAWGNLLSVCNSTPPNTTGAVATKSAAPCKRPQVKEYVRSIRAFLENQHLMEKRYTQECPLHELESIDIKPRAKDFGKLGSLLGEYQQQTVDGKPTETINDLYAAATETMESFRVFLSRIAADVMRTDSKSTIFVAFIKPRCRSLEKARNDYSDRQPGPGESWVYDVIRASILCTSVHEIIAVDNWLHVHAHIVQGKNRFKNPGFTGYRDLLYHVRLDPNDNFHHICEIQVHLQPLWELSKRINSLDYYETFRSYFMPDDSVSQLDLQRDLEAIARVGFVGESYAMTLLRSGGIDRLMRIAVLLDSLKAPDLALKLWELLLRRAGSEKVTLRPDVEAKVCSKIGSLQMQKGNLDEAEKMHRRALSVRLEFVGPTHPDTVSSHNDLGTALLKKEMSQEALVEFQKALHVGKKCSGTRQVELATSWSYVGNALFSAQKLKSASKAFQNALSIELVVLGEDHPSTASTYCNIGRVLHVQQDLEGAFHAFRKSARIREHILGKDHLETAESYRLLGLLLKDSAAYEESLTELEKALDIQLRALGDNHLGTAATFNDIGLLLCHQGELETAIVNFRKAIEICNAIQGAGHGADIATYNVNLGNCLLEQGHHDAASEAFQTALTMFEQSIGYKECVEIATCYSKIGTAQWKQGLLDEALQAYEKAIDLRKRLVGPGHASIAQCYHDKGCILWQQGHLDDALHFLIRARDVREDTLGKLHRDTTDTNKAICSVLWEKHDLERIVSELKRQVDNYDEVKEEKVHDQAVAALYKGMGIALNEMGDIDAALAAFRRALSLRESALGMYHALTADSYADVGVILNLQGDLEGALKMFQQALAIRLKVLGKNHRDTIAAGASVHTLTSKLKS